MLVGTFHYPNLDPVGAPSVGTLAISSLLMLLAWRRSGTRTWRWVLGTAPALLLILTPLITGETMLVALGMRGFPDADDYVAASILLGSGFGLALANFRCPGRAFRLNGTAFTYLYGLLISFVGVRHLWVWGVPQYVAGAGPTGFAVCWTPIVRWLWRRALRVETGLRGCCHVCGYDLRGSLEFGRCPECGTAMRQSEREPRQDKGGGGDKVMK
jgi:hypothetical protein